MTGYPLGSPELRQHVHEVVKISLWPAQQVHEGILRSTGFAVPRSITDLAPDEQWRKWGLL